MRYIYFALWDTLWSQLFSFSAFHPFHSFHPLCSVFVSRVLWIQSEALFHPGLTWALGRAANMATLSRLHHVLHMDTSEPELTRPVKPEPVRLQHVELTLSSPHQSFDKVQDLRLVAGLASPQQHFEKVQDLTFKPRPLRTYTCVTCKRSYTHKCDLIRHQKQVCGKEPMFVCRFCDKRCFYKYALLSHIRHRHPETPTNWASNCFVKDFCFLTYCLNTSV